jgi:hypothetical protein
MTEPRGRAAGWGTLAVAAPAAAVGLAAATGWAVANPPLPTVTPATAQASPAGSEGETTLAQLEQQALAQRARVIRLRRTLHRINVRTESPARAPLPGGRSGPSDPGRSLVPPPPVAAPALPPPTHTSTGAS